MADQKPKVKKVPLQKKFAQEARDWLVSIMQPLFGLTKDWQKHRDIVENNYQLGVKCLNEGHLSDAILRFKIVTWIEPKRDDAWYYLGCAYLANGQPIFAQNALKKSLQLKPSNEETIYMMALAQGKSAPVAQLPKTMPLRLAFNHFESIAPVFTQEQTDLGYQGHTLLCDALHAAMVQGRIDHIILELGVGTGLCGPLMRDVAAKITGVDISGAMLAEAMKVVDEEGNKIYDELINREIHAYLGEARPESVDVIMAASVFDYVGDLQAIFQQTARVLKSGGLFAFTVSKLDGQDFRLDAESGRFLFSMPYLESLAAANGLRIVIFQEAPLYPDNAGWLCIFSR